MDIINIHNSLLLVLSLIFTINQKFLIKKIKNDIIISSSFSFIFYIIFFYNNFEKFCSYNVLQLLFLSLDYLYDIYILNKKKKSNKKEEEMNFHENIMLSLIASFSSSFENTIKFIILIIFTKKDIYTKYEIKYIIKYLSSFIILLNIFTKYIRKYLIDSKYNLLILLFDIGKVVISINFLNYYYIILSILRVIISFRIYLE